MNDIQLIRKLNQLPDRNLPSAYQYDINKFNQFLEEYSLAVNPESIQAFFIENNHLSPNTKRRYIASIKKSLLQIIGSKLTLAQRVEIDIYFKDLKKGFSKKDTSIPENQILTPSELKEVIKVSGKKTGLIIQALFHTACRVSELIHIQLSDCTVRGKIIHVHIIGKGNFERYVQLPLTLYKKIKSEYKSKTYLFETSNKALDRTTVYRLIQKAGNKINRPDLTPHKIRHTWASQNIISLGLVKVSKYLGHRQVQTTANFYLHGKASMEEIFEANENILK